MKILDVPATVLELLSLQAHPYKDSVTWGALQSLDVAQPPVPPLTANMISPELWPWVADIARRVQCPIDYVAAAAVVMVGAVIGTGCAIRPKQKDNWSEIPNVWGAIVGPPGNKKSPAIAQVMAPLHALDAQAQQQYAADRVQYLIDMDRYKVALEHFKKSTKGGGTGASHPGATPQEPVAKRYYTNDSTFEALCGILEGNPRGCLVNHDELTGLFAGFERTGREGERQGYLSAWNGQQSHRVDRVGRGHIYIPRLALSVLGGIQPGKLEEFLAQSRNGFGNDGFMQRLQVIVYPDPIAITGVVDDTPDFNARQKVCSIIDLLAADIALLQPRQDAPDEIPYFRFEEQVQPVFNAWLIDNEQHVQAEDAPLVAEHLAKFKKLAPALALIDHLVGMAGGRIRYGSAISRQSLDRALGYAEYLEAHARRVYALSANQKTRAAALLGKKLEKGLLKDGFSAREVVRKGWSGLTDADDVKAACQELELSHWIARETANKPTAGRPPLPTYFINPAVMASKNAGQAPTKPTKRTKH